MNLEFVSKIYHKFLSNRKTIDFILKIAIAISLTVFLINYISLKEIIAAYKTANINFIIYAVILSVLNIGLQATKWKLVLSSSVGEVQYSKAIASYFAGVSSGLSTPARLGEFIGRALPLKKFNFLDITLMSFVDKIINVLVITFFGAVSAVLFNRVVNHSHFYLDIPLLVVITTLFAFLVYLFFSKGVLIAIVKKKFKENEKITSKISVVEDFLAISFGKKSRIILINIAYYFIILFQFYLLTNAFNVGVDIAQMMFVASLILFATTVIVPFSFGDIGVREGAASYLVVLLGIPAATGFNAALVLFIINVIIPSLFGLILLIKNK